MKKQILVLGLSLITLGLILITSSFAAAQNNNEIIIPLSDPAKRAKLKAHLNYGSITVKGSARKDILIRYTEEDEKRKDDGGEKNTRDGLKRIGGGGMDLKVTESSNYVKVSSDSWNHKLNLEIEVPSGIDVNVHTYNDGDLIISNIEGECAITNYNGEITALNISGSVIATTYNGEIKVTFDKVTPDTPMSFSTYNGDIDITLPATAKATLKMKTEQGDIYTGFDMQITSTGMVPVKDNNKGGVSIQINEWKRGDINGGGAEMSMKTYNGDILVRKK